MASRSTAAKAILLPLSKLYGAGTWVRNKMYDWNIAKQTSFDIPVICIGNIAVGGTGKTPHTEYVVHLLRKTYRVAVLSRGYRRHTKGFVMASKHSTPRDLGDESYQMYHKFGGKIPVAVCENRVAGIQELRRLLPDLQVIVLDDAFQHRAVKPDIAIVLTEFDRPLFQDHLMPYGRLRESTAALSRADIVIATKCRRGIKPLDYSLFDKNLDLIPAQARFFSRFAYDSLRPVFPDAVSEIPYLHELTARDMLLTVSGIANPRPFVRYVKSFEPKVKVNVFPDHHEFNRADMDTIRNRFNSMNGERRYIITTEKDAVRMMGNPYFPHELKPYIFYLPIHIEFVERPDQSATSFDDTLLRMLRNITK